MGNQIKLGMILCHSVRAIHCGECFVWDFSPSWLLCSHFSALDQEHNVLTVELKSSPAGQWANTAGWQQARVWVVERERDRQTDTEREREREREKVRQGHAGRHACGCLCACIQLARHASVSPQQHVCLSLESIWKTTSGPKEETRAHSVQSGDGSFQVLKSVLRRLSFSGLLEAMWEKSLKMSLYISSPGWGTGTTEEGRH